MELELNAVNLLIKIKILTKIVLKSIANGFLPAKQKPQHLYDCSTFRFCSAYMLWDSRVKKSPSFMTTCFKCAKIEGHSHPLLLVSTAF